jgi:hypothetical protein
LFKPGWGDELLTAITICSMPYFRGEVKLGTPFHNILWHAKDLYEILKKLF